MANVKPFQTMGGLKKAATWGTPVLVGAGNGFEFKPPHGISTAMETFANDQANGTAQSRAGDAGLIKSSGTYMMDFFFETVVYPLALAMGTSPTPTQQGADLAYLHLLRILDDLEGIFGTLVFPASTTEVAEFPSVKYDGFDFAVSSSGVATLTPSVICDTVNNNSGSGTNKNSTVASITFPSSKARALGTGMTLRMNEQGGAALGASDKVPISDFSFSFRRGLVGKHTSTGQTKIDEPHPTSTPGHVTVTGKFTMPYYNADAITMRTRAFGTKPQQKADFNIIGPVANGATNYSVAMYLNACQIDGEPRPGQDGTEFSFSAHGVAAAPTGFPTGLTQALGIDLCNTLATSALA